jgi:DedD protein
MSRLLDDDQDELAQRERELTLSTGAILAIFLGLVVLCGLFFGFGYNLGRKSTTAPNAELPAATSDPEPAPTQSSSFDNFKPSPNSPSTAQPAPAAATVTPPAPTPAVATSAPSATTETRPAPAPAHSTPAPTSTPTVTRPATPPPANPSTHTSQSPAPTATPSGAFVVQIAAISGSHKDDADLLVNALHSKGYEVSERTETQDKLIHIQVGPYATKADAEAMRERLIVDGYNAIVK